MSDIKEVLTAWQKGKISGHEAKRLTRCRNYGYLYRRAREHDVEILFKPGDIARKIADGTMTASEGQDILGIEDPAEMPAFVSAWTA